MSHDYSENILIRDSAGHVLRDELGWEVAMAYNSEKLGASGTFGRKSYREVVLWRYFKQAVMKLNPWLTEPVYQEAVKKLESHLASASSGTAFPSPSASPASPNRNAGSRSSTSATPKATTSSPSRSCRSTTNSACTANARISSASSTACPCSSSS